MSVSLRSGPTSVKKSAWLVILLSGCAVSGKGAPPRDPEPEDPEQAIASALREVNAAGPGPALSLEGRSRPFGLALERYRLGAGPTILLNIDPQARGVALATCFAQGSADDPPSQPGLHDLIFQILSSTGETEELRSHAELQSDSICFFSTTPRLAGEAPMAALLDREAERLRRRVPRELERIRAEARGRVIEERPLEEALAGVMLWSAPRSRGYATPARLRALGVLQITRADLESELERNFRAGSAIFAIAGDVERAEVLHALRSKFGAAARRPGSRTKTASTTAAEPRPLESETVVEIPALEEETLVGWLIPTPSDPLRVPSEAIAVHLAGGERGALGRLLPERATGVLADLPPLRHAGLLRLRIAPPTTRSSTIGPEAALEEVLEELRARALGPSRIREIRGALLAQAFRELDSLPDRVEAMSRAQIVGGGLELLEKRKEQIEALSAASIQHAARKVLARGRRVLVRGIRRGDRP